ncbi:MAG: hypothetical protein C0483_18340 [Pirellula sp.]|nr:hypothetical protein [Pirellula sp.]
MRLQPLFAAAEASEPVAWKNLLPVVFLIVLAFYGWSTVLRRRRAGLEIVPETPRRLVPWNGGLTLLSAFLYVGIAQVGAGLLIGYFYQAPESQHALPAVDAQTLTDPQWTIAMFQAHGIMSYASVFAVLVLMIAAAQARLDDFGLGLADWRRYLKLGIIGFAVIVPPVVVMQGLLNVVWKSQHPIIVAYQATGDSQLLFWCTVAAVFVAPFVEEFFFRGVLQGWLERAVAQREELTAPTGDETGPPPPEASLPDPSSVPIVFSSVLFALVHMGSGPDVLPIFFLALGLGYLYRQTHSIWPGFIVHTLLNAWSMLALAFMQ